MAQFINILATTMPYKARAAITDTMMLIMTLVGIAVTFVVMMQSSEAQGIGAISGGAETFFGKNKAKSMEGTLRLLTLIFGAITLVFSVLYFVIDNLPLY